MIAKVVMFIAVLVLLAFVLYVMFTKEHLSTAYVKFILFAYPFLSIDLLPSILSFNIFDFITILFYLFLFKPSKIETAYPALYKYLVYFIFTIIIAGIYFSEEITRETITALIQFLSLCLFIIILYHELLTNSDFKAEVLKGLRYVLVFSFFFLVLQFVFGPSFSFAKSENINVAGGIAIRYPSFFQDPQKYAQFLAAISFLMFINLRSTTTWKQTASGILILLSILAIFLTGGRAALGGWLVGLLVLLFFSKSTYQVYLFLMAILLGVVVYMYQDALPMFKRADLQDSYFFRQVIWNDAINIYKNNQWLGIGIGNYANYVANHHPDQFWINNNEITFYDHPESGYLKILVELGLFGFIAFSLLLTSQIYRGIMTYIKTKNIEHIIYLSSIFSWLTGFYTIYSFGDVRIKTLIAIIYMLSFTSSLVQPQLQKK